ncbi:hypothetical protein JW905_04415 [bacterium]|nr:hypothetical protein [candidate division CSSED10-310 bacterium]
MRKLLCVFLGIVLLSVGVGAADYRHSLGFGAHYFKSLGDIKDEEGFDEDGLAYNVSYRVKLGLLSIEGMLQLFPDGYYNAETAFSPKLFLLVGSNLYGGVGVFSNYVKWRENEALGIESGSEWTDPAYQLRAGLELELIMDLLSIDINANYIFIEWNEVEEFNEDELQFGAGLRLYL